MSDLEMMGLFAYSQKAIPQPLAMVLSADILHEPVEALVARVAVVRTI